MTRKKEILDGYIFKTIIFELWYRWYNILFNLAPETPLQIFWHSWATITWVWGRLLCFVFLCPNANKLSCYAISSAVLVRNMIYCLMVLSKKAMVPIAVVVVVDIVAVIWWFRWCLCGGGSFCCCCGCCRCGFHCCCCGPLCGCGGWRSWLTGCCGHWWFRWLRRWHWWNSIGKISYIQKSSF